MTGIFMPAWSLGFSVLVYPSGQHTFLVPTPKAMVST